MLKAGDMSRPAPEIRLSTEEKETLLRWMRSSKAEQRIGLVHAGHYRRRRRREFLDFMNELVAEYPGKELHVVLDNLNTHKPKEDRWLKAHPNVHLHFIPTHSC